MTNLSTYQEIWVPGISDDPECANLDEIRERLIYSQKLKDAMDRHSTSACGTGWLMLAFSLFGILSNSVSLSVYTHHSMRTSPVNVLLAGLSCIDLFLSIFVLPVFVLPALNLYYRWELVDRVLPYVTFVLYPLTLMTQTASVWVFVVITCERWGAVVRPLQTRRYSSVHNAKKAFSAVCLAAILYNLIRFGEFRLVIRQYSSGSTTSMAKVTPALPDCAIRALFPNMATISADASYSFDANGLSSSSSVNQVDSGGNLVMAASITAPFMGSAGGIGQPPPPSIDPDIIYAPELEPRLRYDATYMFFYYFGLYLLTHFIVPFFLLLIVNIHVVWTILRARALRRHLTTHERREHRIALMMGVVVVAFLICNSIPFAMNLLEAYDRDYFRRVETLYITHLVNDIGNLLVVVHSSTTAFIYYAFSQRYRRHCAAKLLCYFTKRKQRSSLRWHGRTLSFKESFRVDTLLDPVVVTDLCSPATPRSSRQTSFRHFVFFNGAGVAAIRRSLRRKRTL